MASTTKVHGLTIAASVALHGVVATWFSWAALRSLAHTAPTAAPVSATSPAPAGAAADALDLPTVGEGVLVEEEPVDLTGDPPRVTGGDAVAHLDSASPGHGGDDKTPAPAINLADRDERMRLSPDLLSRLDRDQLQRVRVSRTRQSWEDRRATTHPMELTLLVTGSGSLLERRASAPTEPSRGALDSPAPSVRGGAIGAFAPAETTTGERRRGGAELGSLVGSPGVGVMSALAGLDHREAAPVGSARPDVTRAAVAVPALESGRPKDDVDSAQEVATTLRSLVHASTAGGAAGDGQGGASGPGATGFAGSAGAGSQARPLGLDDGSVFDLWTSDPRLVNYFRAIKAKLDPLWADAFPRSALLELKQGTVIIEVTVHADGHTVVSWPPVRPSGIDEFDRNCADAIRRASPLPPIPRQLDVSTLRIRFPFVVDNPIVK